MSYPKILIHVHKKGEKFGKPGEHLVDIRRKLKAEMFGNFNPLFCTYAGEKYLVKSTTGDLSDPFRRDESYLDYLFIEV